MTALAARLTVPVHHRTFAIYAFLACVWAIGMFAAGFYGRAHTITRTVHTPAPKLDTLARVARALGKPAGTTTWNGKRCYGWELGGGFVLVCQ